MSKNGGARHRQKGDRIERELVKLHQALGIPAERYPLSGSSRYRGSGHDLDLYLFGEDDAPAVAEVKSRKGGVGFTLIENWIAETDLLFLKRNHAKPMVVMPWSTWERLLRRKKQERKHEIGDHRTLASIR